MKQQEITAMREALTRLGGFVRELRLDASGEQGRMAASRMYELADKIAALSASQEAIKPCDEAP